MPSFHISESWCSIRTDNWACLPSPLHSAPSNRLTVPPLWQQWEYLGGSALIAKWGSCKGTSKSGWRRGHPRGRERGLLQFHGPVGCISNAWGKERWLWLKLDKPHDRWVSRGTGDKSGAKKSFTVPHHCDMGMVQCCCLELFRLRCDFLSVCRQME